MLFLTKVADHFHSHFFQVPSFILGYCKLFSLAQATLRIWHIHVLEGNKWTNFCMSPGIYSQGMGTFYTSAIAIDGSEHE